MASLGTAAKLDGTIDRLLGTPDGPLSADDITWLADLLQPLFPDYTVAELEAKVARAAIARADRTVEWKRWDS